MMDAAELILREGHLRNERLLITGGGSGLGFEMAKAFAALGADVVICGRRLDVLEAAASEIRDQGGRASAHSCDIRNAETIEAMLDAIWKDAPLTGLVNNAAGNFISRTETLSTRGFDAIADIVFKGTFYATHAVGRRWLAEGRRGSVLSILATWIWNGSPFTVPSTMSKAGIHAMTQSLAMEWGGRGVRLNAIAPGLFPTKGAWERLWPGESTPRPQSPMGRVGEMSELCNLAAFLIGPGVDFLNGETITIDGAAYQATGANFSSMLEWSEEQWDEAEQRIRGTNARDRATRETAA